MNLTDKEFDILLQEIKDMGFTEPVRKEVKAKIAETVAQPVKKAKSKSAIKDSELSVMFADIHAKFGSSSFKNKDLTPLLDGWGLSARQTPSRLKKMVEAGLLSDLGGSPKSYQVV